MAVQVTTTECLVAAFVTVVVGILAFMKWKMGYWQRRGFPSLESSLPFGSSSGLILGRLSIGEQFQEFYSKVKAQGQRHGGGYLFATPFYIVVDPEIAKCIMQKDFQNFVNHGNFNNFKDDPLSGHLFNLENNEWRNMRVKLTPTFTSGKMKMMFQTLTDCAVGLKDAVDDTLSKKELVDVKDILARFTTDTIGSCAFGLECNSLKDPNGDFRKYGKKIFENNAMDMIKIFITIALPDDLLRFMGFKVTKPDVERFFMKVIEDTVRYREENNVYRKDFMHLLLQLKNRGTVADDENIANESGGTAENNLTIEELAAQAYVFFLAGFETSSSTMAWALFELSRHPEIQAKLRSEINHVLGKHDYKVTYDCVMEMTYMDKVVYETLRRYPPVPQLMRKCNKNYTIPGTSITIENGTLVIISNIGLQNDPEFYPDPEKFDPERFSEEAKSKRPPFTYLPFGEGPRLCIGQRFGMMQVKVGLLTLLRNYKLTLNQKTQVPIVFDKKSLMTDAHGGIWLDFEKIE